MAVDYTGDGSAFQDTGLDQRDSKLNRDEVMR